MTERWTDCDGSRQPLNALRVKALFRTRIEIKQQREIERRHSFQNEALASRSRLIALRSQPLSIFVMAQPPQPLTNNTRNPQTHTTVGGKEYTLLRQNT